MFTTYRSAEIFLDLPEEPTSTQVWSCVEQEIERPWFYLQISRRHGTKAYQSMLMLQHAHEVWKWINEQSDQVWVQHVQLVTPPYMNGQSRWLMEPLEEICVVQSWADRAPGYLFKVVNGASYLMHATGCRESVAVTNLIFSAELHLRSI